MSAFKQKVNTILGHVLVMIMSIMVLNVLWQVFSRYILGTPSSFTDELARFLMIWIGILGAAYVSGMNGHVSIDVLVNRTNHKNQKKIKRLVRMFIILFCLFALVIGGFRLVYVTYVLEQYSPSLGLPLAVVYLVLPISGTLIIYYKIADFFTD